MDVDPDRWGRRPTDPRTESQAHRSIYLAGVRAGLRAAATKIEEQAAAWEAVARDHERFDLPTLARIAGGGAKALRETVLLIAALDAEEVAGREP